jgi:hypothetical protein
MNRLAREIVAIIVDEYGKDAFLRRVSDPFWSQALGCVLGYDWHSSGVTTILTGVLRQAVVPEVHGFAFCGGKGGAWRARWDQPVLLVRSFSRRLLRWKYILD